MGKLSRVSDVMNEQVEKGEISGAVTAIALKGEVVHFDAHGWKDIENRVEMPIDAIFRMASSTKPVVGVAVMQLVEQGRVRPDDAVNRYIPEFRDTKVAVRKPGTEPVRKAPMAAADGRSEGAAGNRPRRVEIAR